MQQRYAVLVRKADRIPVARQGKLRLVGNPVTLSHLKSNNALQSLVLAGSLRKNFFVDLGGIIIFAQILFGYGIAQFGRFAGKQRKKNNTKQHISDWIFLHSNKIFLSEKQKKRAIIIRPQIKKNATFASL
jgi:hypothetical protein